MGMKSQQSGLPWDETWREVGLAWLCGDSSSPLGCRKMGSVCPRAAPVGAADVESDFVRAGPLQPPDMSLQLPLAGAFNFVNV